MGNFRIDTDPKTNEGLLYVVKVSEISYNYFEISNTTNI